MDLKTAMPPLVCFAEITLNDKWLGIVPHRLQHDYVRFLLDYGEITEEQYNGFRFTNMRMDPDSEKEGNFQVYNKRYCPNYEAYLKDKNGG